MVSLEMRYTATWITEAANDSFPMRFRIFYDKAFKGTVPPATEYLDSDSILGFPDSSGSQRFVTIADEYLSLPLNAYTVKAFSGHRYFKFRLDTIYNSSGNTSADIETGALLFSVCSGVTNAAGSNPTFAYRFKLKFVDT